jgi:putative transposase
MPWGLKRYYGWGDSHFITWSRYRRQPRLASAAARDLLLSVLELMRERYRYAVIGYIVMPEHVHLLVSEPQVDNPSTVLASGEIELYPAVVRWRRALRPVLAMPFL